MARIIVNGTMIRLLWGGLNLWHLAWLVGFKKLGHDVYFVERSGWENDCYDIAKREMTNDCSYGIGVVSQLLSGYGLSNNWCFVDHYGNYHGLSKTAINEVFEYADLYLDLEWGEWMEESAKVTKRVFVDGEPGWFQLKLQRDVDNGKELPQYDYYSTVGGLIGTSHCDVPVGIWAWDSRNIIIQYNESFNNKTGATKDGGGFDLDGGMVNSIMQYNYSHDNDGPGYLLAQFSYAREHKENIVRYNISENDCRINRYGIIHIWGDIEDAFIYNNTIFHSGPDTSHAYAVAFRYNEDQRILDNFASKISLLNNIFYTSGKLPLVSNPKVDASFHFGRSAARPTSRAAARPPYPSRSATTDRSLSGIRYCRP